MQTSHGLTSKRTPKERDNLTAVVMIGSTEQHGPHLPLGVDGYEAIGIAEGLAEQVDLLVAPPIWYGDADHHLAFPGTFSLSSETVIAVLKDVYQSLLHFRWEVVQEEYRWPSYISMIAITLRKVCRRNRMPSA